MGGCWSLYAWMSFCASDCDNGGADLQPVTSRPAPIINTPKNWNFNAFFTRPPQKSNASGSKLFCSAIFPLSLPDVNEDEGDLRHTSQFSPQRAPSELESGSRFLPCL